ncbi:MAG: hypothetical protein IBX64_08375 [Actinobacteria bacterium]|nr:hypothetical protein [Actinomycetota bacterium]
MDLNHLGIALTAYLTGAVLVYAYINRNRYLDLLLASIAVFSFGTSMLLAAFMILPIIALILFRLATILAVAALFLLAIRIISGIYKTLKRYFGLK